MSHFVDLCSRSCGSEEQQFKRSMGSEHARMHKLQQKFKLRGFSLTVDAAKEFSAFLDESNVSLEEAIEDVVSRIDTVSCRINSSTSLKWQPLGTESVHSGCSEE